MMHLLFSLCVLIALIVLNFALLNLRRRIRDIEQSILGGGLPNEPEAKPRPKEARKEERGKKP